MVTWNCTGIGNSSFNPYLVKKALRYLSGIQYRDSVWTKLSLLNSIKPHGLSSMAQIAQLVAVYLGLLR
jgi:hypothetical protein